MVLGARVSRVGVVEKEGGLVECFVVEEGAMGRTCWGEWVGDLPSGSLTGVVGAGYATREEGGVFDWGVFFDLHRRREDQSCGVCQEGDGQGGEAHDGLLWGRLLRDAEEGTEG